MGRDLLHRAAREAITEASRIIRATSRTASVAESIPNTGILSFDIESEDVTGTAATMETATKIAARSASGGPSTEMPSPK